MARVIIALLLATQFLAAQDVFEEALENWADRSPDGFSLALERTSGPVLQEGELVRIRIHHVSPFERRFGMPPPSIQYQFSGFLLSPPQGGCGTLEQPCLVGTSGIGGFRDRIFDVEFCRDPVETDLNSFVPHLASGTHRVAAVMRKSVFRNSDATETVYGFADPPEYLISRAVEFEVQPASDEWVRQTMQSEREILTELMNQWNTEWRC